MLNLKFPRFWNQLVKILERKQKLKKKTFFDELLQQKQKQSRHKKVDLTFQKKFQNFLKNRSGSKNLFILFIFIFQHNLENEPSFISGDPVFPVKRENGESDF